MESSGSPNRIQVTSEVKKVLEPHDFNFETRGIVDIKGKGQMETFWLQGPRPKKRVLNSTEIEDRFGWNEGLVSNFNSKNNHVFVTKKFFQFQYKPLKPTKIHLQDSWRRNNVLTVQDTIKCLIESLFYSITAIPNT